MGLRQRAINLLKKTDEYLSSNVLSDDAELSRRFDSCTKDDEIYIIMREVENSFWWSKNITKSLEGAVERGVFVNIVAEKSGLVPASLQQYTKSNSSLTSGRAIITGKYGDTLALLLCEPSNEKGFRLKLVPCNPARKLGLLGYFANT